MGATRVVLVSDTHLSERIPEALANWDAVVSDLATDRPDLVVHAGDISADGATNPADLTLARYQLGRLRCPVHVIPGNHDIGDNPHAEGHRALASSTFVDRERLTRYRSVFGRDQWSLDVPGWRLVGANALLFGSGLEEEQDQWRWLQSILRSGCGNRVALFVHKPLVPTPLRPDDDEPGRYVVPEARARLMELLANGGPRALVVSGHVHQFSRHHGFGIDYVWAPTTWATIPDEIQPRHGKKRCGIVDLTLHPDGTSHVTLRRPAGMVDHVLDHRLPVSS